MNLRNPSRTSASNVRKISVPIITNDRGDSLGVVNELVADDLGIHHHVPFTANLDPGKGSRIEGARVQIGLKKSEIDKLEKRLQKLLGLVDEGRYPLF